MDGTTVLFTETHLRDHLGNTRVVFGYKNNALLVKQVNSYYPFGMNIKGLTSYTFGVDRKHPANEYLYNGKMFQDELGLDWLDYGARMYDAVLGRFHTVDPKSEQFLWQSEYNYAANNPIKYIDKNGENPFILIVGGITVADALLLSTGIIATGIIFNKAANGSFAINSNITDYFYKDNPGYREQQKREGSSQRETSQIKQEHAKSVDNNVGKPTPDGDGTPKRGGTTLGKISLEVAIVVEVAKGIIESYPKTSSTNDGNEVTSIGPATTTTESASDAIKNYTLPLPDYTMPSDNTRVNNSIQKR